MKKSDLFFEYPDELIATQPMRPSRILWVPAQGDFREMTLKDLVERIPVGDVLVLNNTKVLKRRIFAGDLEILFLGARSDLTWEVLFPSKKFKVGDEISLPLGRKMKLLQKGRPQLVAVDQVLPDAYFDQVAELPLPPYIQKMRADRHNVLQDEAWYQTAWAKNAGSFAAPTASLHFSMADIERLKSRGVKVIEITLHVGLGTFLPVTSEDLNQHEMHEEYVEISGPVWHEIQAAKSRGARVWGLGTTVCRSLESVPAGFLSQASDGGYSGLTKLLIQPGFQFKIVDCLLTNFHQPESTLLALVAAFSGLERVKQAYQFVIENKFRLFSYGDLSVWIRGDDV